MQKSVNVNWNKEVLPAVQQILLDFKSIGVDHPTVRSVYYKLYGMQVLRANNIQTYKALDRVLVRWRENDTIPMNTFDDERRQEPVPSNLFETPADFAKRRSKEIWDELQQSEYQVPLWYKQPYYVEVWIEKDAMRSTFESVLYGRSDDLDLQVAVQSNAGFNSLTAMNKAYKRFKNIKREAALAGQEKIIKIIYFADLDPSGWAMDRDIVKRLNKLRNRELYEGGRVNFEFERIGVWPEQIEDFNLASDPEPVDIKKAKRNTNYKKFIEDFGQLYLIELDAMAGTRNTETFYNFVRNAVMSHFDSSIWEEEHDKIHTDVVLVKDIHIFPVIQVSETAAEALRAMHTHTPEVLMRI